jgi:sarcosine oxidase gamma subunit
MDKRFHIEGTPIAKMIEFTSYSQKSDGSLAARTFGKVWPLKPGEVRWVTAGRAALLHIAANRWLAPDPSPEIQALIEAAFDAQIGAAVDVTGKWHGISLLGADADRALAACIDIGAVLEGRDCAALRLFDSPTVIARRPDGYSLWVHASFATDCVAMLTRRRPNDSPQSF